MAATDSLPLPLKNVAYRYHFALFDVNGDPVSGATGLDTELSLQDGTFADATNEATEIATASGAYFIDLTAAEMNNDVVGIKVASNAKTHFEFIYPSEDGDIRVNAVQFLSQAVQLDANNLPKVDLEAINGVLAAAVNLALGAQGLKSFTVGAGSTTTTIETDLTETTTDHYKDRDVTGITNNGAQETVSITAYNGTTKQLTVTASVEAWATGTIAVIN
jgi:hypothetical protein